LKVILTKDDLGAMIDAMDFIYNLMDDTNTATLKMEGSKNTGTFWDESFTYSERGATTPFH
jgi:glutaredoxin 2